MNTFKSAVRIVYILLTIILAFAACSAYNGQNETTLNLPRASANIQQDISEFAKAEPPTQEPTPDFDEKAETAAPEPEAAPPEPEAEPTPEAETATPEPEIAPPELETAPPEPEPAPIEEPAHAEVPAQSDSVISHSIEGAPQNTARLNGDKINMRAQPSRDAEIIAVLGHTTAIEVIGGDGEWKLVAAPGVEGYVFAEYIITGEPPEPAAQKVNASPGEKGLIVAIDAGHQANANNAQEPIGPGSGETKPKVASGTAGVSTKVPEYKLTLEVALKLRDELISRGYGVYMIRETNDVNISNRERAEAAASAGAHILVRLHADGSENSGVSGILTLCPTKNNRYVPQLYAQSRALSDDILSAMVAQTGAKNRGVSEVDNMSGINWSAIPVTIVEMGLMTNPREDELMQTAEYQAKLVNGIANGVDSYFAR